MARRKNQPWRAKNEYYNKLRIKNGKIEVANKKINWKQL